jgi:ABC-type dipeptide/oligopeptide/nickel transport system permease component
MTTYLIRRLLLMIPTLVGITFLVFMIVALAPGGIGASLKVSAGAMESQKGTAVLQAYLDDRYGLDDPVIVQYGRWLGRICPIKFGTREQIGPAGEVVRPPKRIKDPPLWRWIVDELPAPPPVQTRDLSSMTDEQKDELYQATDRAYADARQSYIAGATIFKQALKDYATEAAIPRALDRDAKVRESVLARHTPDKSLPTWQGVQQRAAEMIAAYRLALAAQSELAGVFAGKPYRQAGVGIDGVVSIAAPDFGVAFSRGRPVLGLVARALPVTLLLNLIAIPIIYMVAIPGGMLAAVKRGTALDAGLGAAVIGLWSFPVVLAGVLSIGFLASVDYLGAFPAAGLHSNGFESMPFFPHRVKGEIYPGYLVDMLWHICLPVMCLVYTGFAILSKQTRAAMLENFSADYVRTAKAKGVAPRDVVFRHVFRNSLLPIITMFVSVFPTMLAGSVVVEKIFTVPGMGSLILEAIVLRDRELLLANTLMIAAVNLLALLLADILYALADPRVAYD